jgi:hypothetical protein
MRITVFLLLGLLAGAVRQAPAQITGINGELRYQHRYQDVLSSGLLSTSRQMSPMLALGITGKIVSPRLAFFSLRSNISSNFNSAGAGPAAFSGNQYSWDYYDFTMGLLQYSLVKFDVGAREGVLETTTDLANAPPLVTRSRRREQRLSAATHKVRFLPSTSLSYERSRSWSVSGTPFDQRSDITTLAMSSVNGSTSLSMSGSLADIRESVEDLRERYVTVQVDAGKEFSARNRVDLSSAYNSYPGFRSLSGSLSYAGARDDGFSMGTSLFGNVYAGAGATTRVLTAAQTFRFTQDEHFQYVLTGLARSRDEVRAVAPPGVAPRVKEFDWNAGADVQHVRDLGFANLTNTLTTFYGEQHGADTRRTIGGRFSVGLQAMREHVQGDISYSLGGDLLQNRINRRHVSQNADARLTAGLGRRFSSTTKGEFRDERYFGDVQSFRNRRLFIARQSFNGSFHAVIPFALSAGASVTWYASGIVGRTYGWNASFTSGHFFARGLTAAYTYSRTFDPYYQREVLEQTAELRLQWRRLAFDLRLRQYDFFNRIRDVLFTVSRPL